MSGTRDQSHQRYRRFRFEGIDALETHFSASSEEFHQPLELALAARDELLARAGFGEIQWFASQPFKVESVENHPVRGYILSAGLDTYGRAVSFAYVGEHPATDGTRLFVTAETLADSLNAHLLRTGHAYAGFYLGLPTDLREFLRQIVQQARHDRIGLWAQASDAVGSTLTIATLAELQARVLWPKLFRRLAPYFQEGHTNFDGLDAWLRADPLNRDDRLILPTVELGNMHDMLVAAGNTLQLAYFPEDVVIVPDDYVLEPAPVPGPVPDRPALGGRIRIVAALVEPHPEPDSGNETVTLLNVSAQDVDVTDWFISDANGRQRLGGTIARGDAMRVRLGLYGSRT